MYIPLANMGIIDLIESVDLPPSIPSRSKSESEAEIDDPKVGVG